MTSPFIGMDPYLEGELWPDVHNRLATEISDQLAPHLQPKYMVRLELQVIEDSNFMDDIGIMYPDVEILHAPPYTMGYGPALEPVATIAPMTLKIPQVKVVNVQILDTKRRRLVTSIEILSPVNKREPNLTKYRQKRDRLRQAGVHLLEIDLLRRGTRVWEYRKLPQAAYMIALTRAETTELELWPLQLASPLPIVPIPLRYPDKEVPLDLSAALKSIYAKAYYNLSINYHQQPPPPKLSPEEWAWVQQITQS